MYKQQELTENATVKCSKIRRLEETLLDLFSQGELFGTTHTSIGQEATAVAAMSQIREGDVVFSNHRCHGHFLAYGGPLKALIAEPNGANHRDLWIARR